jgi:acetate---CoA ligase (ADP-forming)
VAIIGASPQPDSPRNKIVRALLKHGFPGSIYPITQTHREIEGLKAFPRVGDLPEVPDVALIITPAATVADLVRECGLKGIRNAIVFSAGFEETESGKEHAARLAEAARACDVHVLGPNCQGIWSVANKSMLTYSPAAISLESLACAPIAVISQSGALAGAIGLSLQRNGMGFSYLVSVGNETCLDALDVLEHVVELDDLRVVALYVEGLEDGARILRISARARARGIQIVLLKSGRSEVGQLAAASHTGKMASSYAVYRDVLEQAGVVTVDSVVDLLIALEAFAFLKSPRVTGDPRGGLSVLSSSGGAGALLADHGSEYGVPMAQFSANTQARLEEFLPAFARKANPIDLTGQINRTRTLFRDTCLTLAEDPRTEALVIQHTSSGRQWLKEDEAVYKSLGHRLPVIVSFVGEALEPELQRSFRDCGVMLAADPVVTMKALGALYRGNRALSLPPAAAHAEFKELSAPHGWGQTMELCADCGIIPAAWRILKAGDRASEACSGLKLPLVVKALAEDVEHKTEGGFVKLRVASFDAVDNIAGDFRRRLGKPEAGILVQEMVRDGVEVVLSCLRGTDFGPVISLGSGGVAIELYRDVTYLALPVSAEDVRRALSRLKLGILLGGFRGQPAADVDALIQAAVALGNRFLNTPSINELELNPVIVGKRGDGITVVDALVGYAAAAGNN